MAYIVYPEQYLKLFLFVFHLIMVSYTRA